MKETPESFVHWLMNQYDDPTKRQELSHTEIYGRLQNVEAGLSMTAQAISEHEKFTSWVEAGFSRMEALKLLLNDRAAMISAAVAQQAHQKDKDGDQG